LIIARLMVLLAADSAGFKPLIEKPYSWLFNG